MPQSIDRVLHAARISKGREKVTFRARPVELPNGTIFVGAEGPTFRWNGVSFVWDFSGYQQVDADHSEEVSVLTPKPLVDLYSAGWTPHLKI